MAFWCILYWILGVVPGIGIGIYVTARVIGGQINNKGRFSLGDGNYLYLMVIPKNRDCHDCVNHGVSSCPNSAECYSTLTKPHYERKCRR